MKVLKNVNLYGSITDISIENGKIAAIGKTNAPGKDFHGNKIYPGLIDIHIHGCIGYDTMEGGLEEMADWLLSQGTTAWYPTTMSMSLEDTANATSANIDFGHGASIPGFHMEGPFLNPECCGAMNINHIIPASKDFFNACKNVKRITVAPEIKENMDFIKDCPVQVSIGHTKADYDTALAAFSEGATSLTHTYNVMPGIHHRAPGPIGAVSDSASIYAELICDGIHIHPSAVRMLTKMLGTDRIILISDAMRATGLGDGEYLFGGRTIQVKGEYALTDTGNLAGSTATLLHCVKKAIEFGIPEVEAVKMASENPARLMNLNKGKIEVGYDADFIIVDNDFNLIEAIARGEF
jgi:N-acetylglucosamine-6-phosphate deacetylase